MSNTDHPRSRGEYHGRVPLPRPTQGSSPLSRGIHPPTQLNGFLVRIIPALAGNTPHVSLRRGRFEDHPRSRGEYSPRRIR